jgi:hypothetical protein
MSLLERARRAAVPAVTAAHMPAHAGQNSTGTRLVNASMSMRGWSRLSRFVSCPYRFARHGSEQEESDALSRGSLGHVILAHLAIHEAAEQGFSITVNNEVVTPEQSGEWMSPLAALRASAMSQFRGMELLASMQDIFAGHLISRTPPSTGTFRHVEVESELAGVIGYRNKERGLWLVHPSEWDKLRDKSQHWQDENGETRFRAYDGGTIRATKQGSAGGDVVWMSRRLDAVWDTPNGIVVVDHKHKAKIDGKTAERSYHHDLGFTVISVLAAQRWPASYSHTALQFVSTASADYGRTKIVILPRDASNERRAWRDVFDHEVDLARYKQEQEAGTRSMYEWPRRRLEVGGPCQTAYGRCPFFDECHPMSYMTV